jgi:hypothetical protein
MLIYTMYWSAPMSGNQKESEKSLKSKDSNTPSSEKTYRTEDVEYYVGTRPQATLITNPPTYNPPTVEKTHSPEEYERDPGSGCRRYKRSIDPKTVLQHLSSLVGADVDVTLDIQIRVPDGIPENVVRTVSENSRTLKFNQYGFEKE